MPTKKITSSVLLILGAVQENIVQKFDEEREFDVSEKSTHNKNSNTSANIFFTLLLKYLIKVWNILNLEWDLFFIE